MKNPAELKEYLTSKNIKPSYQRMKIYEYLMNNATHPSVDQIYLALAKEIPTLSKTTVYNTLKLLIDNGLVKLISIEEAETRYDADVSTHGHFKCVSCKNIYDFNVDLDKSFTEDLKEYTIYEKSIYFKGICKDCNNKIHI